MGAQVKVSPKLKRLKHNQDYEDEDEEEEEVVEGQQIGFLKGVFILFVLGFVLFGLARGHFDIMSSLPFKSTYVVQKGDSLWSIVKNQYPGENISAKMQQIRDINNFKGNQIQVGQKLKLP